MDHHVICEWTWNTYFQHIWINVVSLRIFLLHSIILCIIMNCNDCSFVSRTVFIKSPYDSISPFFLPLWCNSFQLWMHETVIYFQRWNLSWHILWSRWIASVVYLHHKQKPLLLRGHTSLKVWMTNCIHIKWDVGIQPSLNLKGCLFKVI